MVFQKADCIFTGGKFVDNLLAGRKITFVQETFEDFPVVFVVVADGYSQHNGAPFKRSLKCLEVYKVYNFNAGALTLRDAGSGT